MTDRTTNRTTNRTTDQTTDRLTERLTERERDSAIRRLLLLAAAAMMMALGLPGLFPQPARANDELRLDQLVIKGTHNSYHRRPFFALHVRHRYEHDSLHTQLEQSGVRAFEFDLHLNGEGDYEVYHLAYLDSRSHCRAFESCLGQLREWSDQHRDHEPLIVWIEAKDFAGGERMESLRPVDDVIRRVLGDRLITPDDVLGGHDSLRSAIALDGWPTLGESRGRVLFMLTASDEQRADYTDGFRHLADRAMFIEASREQFEMPWAVVAKLGDPRSPNLQAAREAGLLITATTCAANFSDAACAINRDIALTNGVNVLMDDYVRPVVGRDYYLDLGFTHIAVGEASRTPTAMRQGRAPGQGPATN